METVQQLCDKLQAVFATLPEKDKGFAGDLLASCRQRNSASSKQEYWLKELARRGEGKPDVRNNREKVALGDFDGMNKLFDFAKTRMKRAPKITFATETDGEIVISVAGPNARVPGSLNVATPGGYGNSTWYGRILQDGNFEVSPRTKPSTSLLAMLARFAAEPHKVASEYGRKTGNCCFCNKKLTDERSLYVGYGGTCAKNWDLPWGNPEDVTMQWLMRGQAA